MANGSPACYNPKVFTPDNKPLLSKGEWSMIQVYLENCLNLPLQVGPTPPKQFPYQDSVDVYKIINAGAHDFKTKTLPAANAMANTLYNYGQTANATFSGVIQLMQSSNPSKQALQQLFANLEQTASNAQKGAKDIFDQTKSFVDMLGEQGGNLTTLKNKYINQAGGLKDEIKSLNDKIKSEHVTIDQAQAKITADKKVIHDTVYYSWIPLIGTIVALVEIIEHDKDIKHQLDIIQKAVSAIQGYNATVQKDQAEMAQLIYADTFNANQVSLMNAVLPKLEKIEGAWGTMATEAGDVLNNINQAEENALNNIACLAEVQLTTAQNEWLDVANDAHDFMMNFYLTSEDKMPAQKAA